jgi:insertion element IS1 protein InsB
MNKLGCPRCGVLHINRNGHTHYGKQNHRCKACGRQFVADSQHIAEAERELVKKLLLERISLSGICRVMCVSLRWLLSFIAELYESQPDDLNVQLPECLDREVKLLCLEAEADELWSFVSDKANPQWVWIAIDAETRQVIAFHVGDRSRRSARKLWGKIPAVYRRQASFETDGRGLTKVSSLPPGTRSVTKAPIARGSSSGSTVAYGKESRG